MVKFDSIHPYNYIRWNWYDPNGSLYQTSYQIVEEQALPITAVDNAIIGSNRALYEQYLGQPFEVEIHLGEAYVTGMIWPGGQIIWGFRDVHLAFTETFIVVKHNSSISIALSSDSITYGQSVQVSSQRNYRHHSLPERQLFSTAPTQ